MVDASRSVRDLVDRLESHLHAEEREFCKSLQILESTSDEALDELFLREDFDRCKLLKQLSVTNLDKSGEERVTSPGQQQPASEDMQDVYLKQVEKSTVRLREYLETLTNQIVKIVEKESDSFMDVASKLDGFRQILSDLKDSHSDFHTNFVNEKAKTQQVYGYLLEQHAQLREMITERNELATQLELQSLLAQVQERVDSSEGSSSVLQLEETARIWNQVWSKSEGRDAVQQKLQMYHRKILSKLNASFFDFVAQSRYFEQARTHSPSSDNLDDQGETDEDDSYFEVVEMSSYLRAFKQLRSQDTLYQLLHVHILTKQIDQITKDAYQAKNTVTTLKRDQIQLPLHVFVKSVKDLILEGSLKNLIALTTSSESENYVAGYKVLDDCLWPSIVRAIDTSLSFVTSTANLEIFQINYKCCEEFIAELRQMSLSKGDELLSMFNLATYSEFVAMELSDIQAIQLSKVFPSEQQRVAAAEANPDFSGDAEAEQENQICKLCDQTIELCLLPLQEEHYYLPRVGDKLIKLSIQIIVRHLNFITQRITERKMRTQFVLSILEDLHNIQVAINKRLVPQIESRLLEVARANGDMSITQESISENFVAPLIGQVMKRFELVQKPCRAAMASKAPQTSRDGRK